MLKSATKCTGKRPDDTSSEFVGENGRKRASWEAGEQLLQEGRHHEAGHTGEKERCK